LYYIFFARALGRREFLVPIHIYLFSISIAGRIFSLLSGARPRTFGLQRRPLSWAVDGTTVKAGKGRSL